MDDFLRNKNLDQESIKSFEKADIIITITFASLDIIVIFLSLYILKSKNKKINFLNQRVIRVFLIDIIIRILYTRKYFKWNIYKELLFALMNTGQFYLIISFIDIAGYTPNISKLKKTNDKIKRVKICLFFFFLSISYENFSYPNNIIFIVENIRIDINRIIILIELLCILFFVNRLYIMYKEKIREIGNIVINEFGKNVISLLILGSPLTLIYFFSIYYTLKILFLLIKNPVILLYANIALIIFKEGCKYLGFSVVEAIIYSLNKINVGREKKAQKEHKNYIDEYDIINI